MDSSSLGHLYKVRIGLDPKDDEELIWGLNKVQRLICINITKEHST